MLQCRVTCLVLPVWKGPKNEQLQLFPASPERKAVMQACRSLSDVSSQLQLVAICARKMVS